MNNEIPYNITAEEWLTHEGMGNLKLLLDKHESAIGKDPSSQSVTDAIFAKGTRPRDNFLAPGEFSRLIEIIRSSYPRQFSAFLDRQIQEIKFYIQHGWTKERLLKAKLTTEFVELKDALSQHPQFPDVADFIEWV